MSVSSKTANIEQPALGRRLVKAVLVTIWVVAAFFGGAIVMQLIDRLLAVAGFPLSNLSSTVEVAVKTALMYVSAALIAIGIPLTLQRKKLNWSTLGLNRLPEWSDILLGPVAFIPYYILTLILMLIAVAVLPGFDVSQVQETGFQSLTNQTGYVMAFLTLVVMAPLAEEVLFRGYLYGRLKRYIGLIGAIVLTSLCFAVLHLQLNVGIDVFALSIVLCVLREFTGSIWAGVLLHMTKNFIAFYFLFIAPFMV